MGGKVTKREARLTIIEFTMGAAARENVEAIDESLQAHGRERTVGALANLMTPKTAGKVVDFVDSLDLNKE